MHKRIGILGGMGPSASARFYQRLVDYTQSQYGAVQDEEYPQILLNSITLEGFDETGIVDPDLVKKQLIEGIKFFRNGDDHGADIIAIPCNTVHAFYESLQGTTPALILNILDLTVQEVSKNHRGKVGIVCSSSTRDMELYATALKKIGIEPVVTTDEEQEILNELILKVMSGKNGAAEVARLRKVVEQLKERGAEAIILGCTELPLIAYHQEFSLPMVDSLEVLAKAAVEKAMQN